ncbi:YdeI/OmpD-associated family protein [Coraliomargarita sp. W4R72]
MTAKPTNVDEYLKDGCGRCALGGTPQCKVHPWHEVLRMLRAIVLESELTEEIKWGAPCYTHASKNILMLSALKERVVVSFFRGAEIKDVADVLELPGENTRFARCIRITEVTAVAALKPVLLSYIAEAIKIETSGKAAEPTESAAMEPPEELLQAFATNAEFKAAFTALTLGRQRGYLIYFASAKQSKTKAARIEKCMPKIFSGKGWNERP